jgi:hypothetical protein
LEALTQAAHDHDVEALLACLSPTVIVRSPITQRIRFVGIDEAAHLFRQVFAVVSDIRVYATVGEDDRTQAIFWRGRVGRHYLEEANLLRLDEDGLIAEMTVFMRPVPGLLVFASRLAPLLARRRGRFRPATVRAVLGTTSTVYRSGERSLVRLTGVGMPVPPVEQKPRARSKDPLSC